MGFQLVLYIEILTKLKIMLNLGHKNLDTWSESIKLTAFIYQLTTYYHKSEQYGLISQMRRAAV